MEYSAVGAALILSARQVSNGQAFMSAQAKASEPSMEEILASIRRIISDDDAKPAEGEAPAADAAAAATAPAPVQAPEPAPAPAAAEEDVLDLGAEAALIAAPPPEPPAPEPAPAPVAPAAEEPDVAFVEEAPPAPPPAPEPVSPSPAAVFIPSTAAPAMDMASLLSDQASSAVTNAFGHLANTVLSNNARTLEDLVKEMLKPMLKAWLDDNLPSMVERLVRAEIERVARGGRS